MKTGTFRCARWRLALLAFCCLNVAAGALPARALAGGADRKVAEFASGAGNVLYTALGVGLPLLEDGHEGGTHSLRALDALGTSALISEGLKRLTREKRPDSDRHNSFPSGHATGAFAVAAMESAFHRSQAPLWYASAALIAASRLRLHRHYLHDVLAGAALGYFTARWELSQPRGLLLAPLIRPSRHRMALQIRKGF